MEEDGILNSVSLDRLSVLPTREQGTDSPDETMHTMRLPLWNEQQPNVFRGAKKATKNDTTVSQEYVVVA